MLYGSAAKRSLARHPIKPRGSATLTVSNCERTLTDIERESFLSLFRSTEALGSEEERECVMISAPQNRGLFCHFFFFSEGPESGVSFAPSFPFFPSDQFSLLKAEKREEKRESVKEIVRECGERKLPKTKYLVDPASSICLSQRLSHACLSTSR
jgi:hypothetical protein